MAWTTGHLRLSATGSVPKGLAGTWMSPLASSLMELLYPVRSGH